MTYAVQIVLPDEVLEEVAARAAELVVVAREPERRWLTLAEAGEQLGCSADAVRKRLKRGRLRGRYQGARLYVDARSLEELG